MALDPIPASHAKIMLLISSGAGISPSTDAEPAFVSSEDWPFESALAAFAVAWLASKLSSSCARSILIIGAATKNETIVATNTPPITPMYAPGAVIPRMAMIDPGDAGPVKAAFNSWKVNVPDTPPAITARNNKGFIITYGK